MLKLAPLRAILQLDTMFVYRIDTDDGYTYLVVEFMLHTLKQLA